jgi:protoheme IX farnesyltransferase
LFGTYYRLTKPGIIYGNLFATAAGFLFASHGEINFALFAAVLSGTALSIASACVFNNYLDRDIDAKMKRTRRRALAAGKISVRAALIYATALGLIGSAIMILFVNPVTFLVGAIGFFFYVVLYTPIKKRSVYGTLIGSVSGATPPVAGYTAVSGQLDIAALLLFIILVVWQMPHFYSIAIFRLNDYKQAKIPVLPIVRGIKFTKITMAGYIILFIFATTVLRIAGFTTDTYLTIMLIVGFAWLWQVLKGFKTKNDILWAKKTFKLSLIVLMIFCLTISLNIVLP